MSNTANKIDADSKKQKTNTYLYDSYIRITLGRYLPRCLQVVAELRPADPIGFMAQWLYKVYDSQMYYKAKMMYLNEICAIDTVLKCEHEEHKAKMKPFLEAMRVEKWNYYVSLIEELDALANYIDNVDVPVDEKSKQRFMEVLNLLHQEEIGISMPEDMRTLARNERKAKSRPIDKNAEGTCSTPVSFMSVSIKSTKEGARYQRRMSFENSGLRAFKSALESTKSGKRLSRLRKVSSRRCVREFIIPSRKSSSGVLTSKMHTRLSQAVMSSSPSELGVGKDSDGSTVSAPANKDSNSLSFLSQCRDIADYATKPKGKTVGKSDLGTSNIMRYLLDEHTSGSSNTKSVTCSSYYSDDSNVEIMGKSLVERLDNRNGSKEKDIGLDDSARSKTPQMKQQFSFKRDVLGNKMPGKYRQLSRDDSCSSVSQVSSAGVLAFTKLPPGYFQGKSLIQRPVRSSKGEHDHILPKMHACSKQGPSRSSRLPQTDKFTIDYPGEPEDSEISRIEGHSISAISRPGSSPEMEHLPPLKTQADLTRLVYVGDQATSSGHSEQQLSEYVASSDQCVELPAVPAGCRTTGTVIMTNTGHIAFVNKELGVIASNALKIKYVHPIDKPEMWEQRRFQCQTFYDHELYSQIDHLALDSEDEAHRPRDIPQIATNQFYEPSTRGRDTDTDKDPT